VVESTSIQKFESVHALIVFAGQFVTQKWKAHNKSEKRSVVVGASEPANSEERKHQRKDAKKHAKKQKKE